VSHRCPRITALLADDGGSVLAIVLVFMMLFGLTIGVTLEFAATGERTSVSTQEQAVATYAGSGALDAAINRLSTGTTLYRLGATPGTCLTFGAGQAGNAGAIDVTCTPRAGWGGNPGPALRNQPADAVLALSDDAAEGVELGAGSTLTARGAVRVAHRLRVPTDANLTSSGDNAAVLAGSCAAANGTISPACQQPHALAAPVATPLTRFPTVVTKLPTCSDDPHMVALSPGTYLSGAAVQAALDCRDRVVWLRPGTYYFDFQDAVQADRALRVPADAVVVGGTASGWAPGTTLPTDVPIPTPAQPTRSACTGTASSGGPGGVQLVFAGESRLDEQPGTRVQLCADETSTTSQHVVLRAPTTGDADVTSAMPAAAPTVAMPTTSTNPPGVGSTWTRPTQGAVVDGPNARLDDAGVATATAPAGTITSTLRVGPLPAGTVPPGATGVKVAVTLTGGMVGTGRTNLALTDGSTSVPAGTARTCNACNDTVVRTTTAAAVQDPALTPSFVNAMYVDVTVSSTNAFPTVGAVDGLLVSVDYSAPLRPTRGSGRAMPYVSGGSATTPVLHAAGAYPATVLALHGTVDAQQAAVDLALTLVPYVVADRGLAVRHLVSSLTPAAGYSGPLVAVPDTVHAPRRVLMVAKDRASGAELGRADVMFADIADQDAAANGGVPTVESWAIG
jgi:hypothetical protein